MISQFFRVLMLQGVKHWKPSLYSFLNLRTKSVVVVYLILNNVSFQQKLSNGIYFRFRFMFWSLTHTRSSCNTETFSVEIFSTFFFLYHKRVNERSLFYESRISGQTHPIKFQLSVTPLNNRRTILGLFLCDLLLNRRMATWNLFVNFTTK